PRARGLWVTAGSWCGQHETDGKLPAKMIAAFGITNRDAQAPVDSGLWKKTAAGWAFHDWSKFQPTKAQKNADRKAAAERMRRAREARARCADRGGPIMSDANSGDHVLVAGKDYTHAHVAIAN